MTGIDREPLRWLRVGAGFVAVVLLVSVTITGALLTWRYRPATNPFSGLPRPSAGTRWSRRLVRRHQFGLLLAIPSVLLWGGLTVHASWDRLRAVPRRRIATVSGVSAAALLTFTTALAWRLVKWEQIAMLAVTVGADIKGLWYAGFSDEVRFVIVRGVEVSRGTVGFWVVVHLLAPLLALVAIGIAWAAAGHGAATTRATTSSSPPRPAAPPAPAPPPG